jgi:hypothetical protein
MGLSATLSTIDTQHTSIEYRHAECNHAVMQSVAFFTCYAECCNAQCRYAECLGAGERDICNRRWYVSSQTDRKRDRERKMTGGRAIF